VVEQIAAQRVVPVLRARDPEDAVLTVRACARAGMTVVELTRTTPDVLDVLRELRNDRLVLGLGTLTNADQVAPAVASGARFVVSFARPPGIVDVARNLGVTAIPGALTPSEVLGCVSVGAELVKLFPARVLTPAYVGDLRALMPELRVMVTGGIAASLSSIRPWLDAGAVALGLGGDLGTVASVGAEEVERRACVALDSAARTSA
jgi:2-dehydro-3-deoxyphosphogluconate aldolase/(4S)-4-hydroxy-2-oxoglutarate aldolase